LFQFPGDLAVLSFPSNQFGHQENGGGEEILNLLKHVRPGNGFQFKGDMFDKVRRIYSLASTININIFRIVLKTNLNIARVQNCSDITILNMFLSGWSW